MLPLWEISLLGLVMAVFWYSRYTWLITMRKGETLNGEKQKNACLWVKRKTILTLRFACCAVFYDIDVFWTATRKKLAATASRRESVYNRAGEPSMAFCERGGARKQADGLSFCHRQKNKPEQSGLCSGMAYPGGFEPLTFGVGVQRSIQLSYEYLYVPMVEKVRPHSK